jgi:LmbE family N-acetylglucosaminyl deacetylase
VKPDLIFVNYEDDTHQDHRSVAKAVITAARYTKNLLFYEVPTTLNFVPAVFSDIGSVIGDKVRLLKCHRSQIYKTRVKNLSIIETAKSTAVFRGYQDRVKYAEGFAPQRLLLDLILK